MDFLQFKDDGRTLTCRSASSPATPGTNWWWLEVTGENQRYAAFRTEPTDTAGESPTAHPGALRASPRRACASSDVSTALVGTAEGSTGGGFEAAEALG